MEKNKGKKFIYLKQNGKKRYFPVLKYFNNFFSEIFSPWKKGEEKIFPKIKRAVPKNEEKRMKRTPLILSFENRGEIISSVRGFKRKIFGKENREGGKYMGNFSSFPGNFSLKKFFSFQQRKKGKERAIQKIMPVFFGKREKENPLFQKIFPPREDILFLREEPATKTSKKNNLSMKNVTSQNLQKKDKTFEKEERRLWDKMQADPIKDSFWKIFRKEYKTIGNRKEKRIFPAKRKDILYSFPFLSRIFVSRNANKKRWLEKGCADGRERKNLYKFLPFSFLKKMRNPFALFTSFQQDNEQEKRENKKWENKIISAKRNKKGRKKGKVCKLNNKEKTCNRKKKIFSHIENPPIFLQERKEKCNGKDYRKDHRINEAFSGKDGNFSTGSFQRKMREKWQEKNIFIPEKEDLKNEYMKNRKEKAFLSFSDPVYASGNFAEKKKNDLQMAEQNKRKKHFLYKKRRQKFFHDHGKNKGEVDHALEQKAHNKDYFYFPSFYEAAHQQKSNKINYRNHTLSKSSISCNGLKNDFSFFQKYIGESKKSKGKNRGNPRKMLTFLQMKTGSKSGKKTEKKNGKMFFDGYEDNYGYGYEKAHFFPGKMKKKKMRDEAKNFSLFFPRHHNPFQAKWEKSMESKWKHDMQHNMEYGVKHDRNHPLKYNMKYDLKHDLEHDGGYILENENGQKEFLTHYFPTCSSSAAFSRKQADYFASHLWEKRCKEERKKENILTNSERMDMRKKGKNIQPEKLLLAHKKLQPEIRRGKKGTFSHFASSRNPLHFPEEKTAFPWKKSMEKVLFIKLKKNIFLSSGKDRHIRNRKNIHFLSSETALSKLFFYFQNVEEKKDPATKENFSDDRIFSLIRQYMDENIPGECI